MERKKILVTTSTFPRWINDSGSPFVLQLCQKLQDSGFEVVVLAPHAPGALKSEIWSGLKVYRYQYLPGRMETLSYEGGILPKLKANKLNYLRVPFFLFSQLLAVSKIVKRENINIIHAHWIIPQGLISVLYKRLFNRRVKIVCTSHGSDIFGLKGGVLNVLKAFVLAHIDQLTVVSSAMEREVRKINKNIKVEILPMGVDFQKFFPRDGTEKIKEKYGIQGPLLLFVGRLSEEKGIQYLLGALPAVLKRFSDAKLLIAGEGMLRGELEALCRELRVADHVLFVGHVDIDELPKYYSAADIFIGPSLREGFGLVFAEALACRCCVIAPELPAISDIVINHKTGLIVRLRDSSDIAEKIGFVLCHKDIRDDLAETGYAHVTARFDSRKIAASYASLFDSLR